MRAKEFIVEQGKMPPNHVSATPGMKSHPQLDNSSPYAPWRFASMYLSGAPDFEHEPEKEGPIGQHLVTSAYSDADEAIISAAEKKFGTTSKRITPRGSSELEDVHKVSPVRVNKHIYGSAK